MKGVCPIKTTDLNVESIVALEPCYGAEGGNATRIYDKHGQVSVDPRRLETVLRQLARYYSVDPAALRKNYGRTLSCSQYVPLPFSVNFILVALKMRRPLTENDSATGYINLSAVEDVIPLSPGESENGVRCLVRLQGGHSLPSLYSLKNTEKRIATGRLSLELHERLHAGTAKSGGSLVKRNPEAHARILAIAGFIYDLAFELT